MKLPTRDQARRIASDKCEDNNRCDECDIAEWCGEDMKYTTRLGKVAVALYAEIDKRDGLIRRMAGMMKRARPERISIAGPHADPFDPKYLICCPFCVTADYSDEKILTTLEHEDDCL